VPLVAIRCPSAGCDYTGSVDASLAGRSVSCPRCGTNINIPASPAPGGVLSRVAASKQPRPVTPWEIGETVLEDYRVEGKLGEGGMGIVYRVVHIDDPTIEFAVKRARTRDDASRRSFMAELQTWVDLPEHPNLAACCFFRTEGDEVVIFADYLAGGSLSSWIADGRLATLESVLDVAIQFAWGLHQAHELGLVHQDVKPGNVLMAEDGIAKVADFGLSRARARAEAGQAVVPLGAGGTETVVAGGSVLVSFGGLTPAYCSPEQAEGQRLSRRSDQWSWAVSVLEMFTGEVTWGYGTAAPDALGAYATEGGGRLPLPDSVAAVLRRCLEWSPESRYESMNDVADALRRAYECETGVAHDRERPAVLAREEWALGRYERRTIMNDTWRHPREWLELALREAGRDASDIEAILPDYSGSKRAQEIADLSAYETAHNLLSTLVRQGRDLEPQLARLCTEKGNIHYALQDVPGCLAMHEQATRLLERLVSEGRAELLRQLALARTAQATAARYQGPYDVAIEAAGRAVSVLSQLAAQAPTADLPPQLARAWHAQALALNAEGRNMEALRIVAAAIPWMHQAIGAQPSDEAAAGLAYLHSARAQSLFSGNSISNAIEASQSAVQLFRWLVYERGRVDFLYALAVQHLANGSRYHMLDHNEEAQSHLDWAIKALGHVVDTQGEAIARFQLAQAWSCKGVALRRLKSHGPAIESAQVSVAMLQDLVRRHGRTELVVELADGYASLGTALFDAGRQGDGIQTFSAGLVVLDRRLAGSQRSGALHLELALLLWLADRSSEALPHATYAIEALSHVIAKGGTAAKPDLGRAVGARALVMMALGDERAAQADARSAVPILREQYAATGRASLKAFLDHIDTHCGHLL